VAFSTSLGGLLEERAWSFPDQPSLQTRSGKPFRSSRSSKKKAVSGDHHGMEVHYQLPGWVVNFEQTPFASELILD
jgi:hypothetical protein